MNRAMLIFAVVVIVLILLACVGYMSGRWEETEQRPGVLEWMLASASSEPIELCVADEEARERVKAITFQALDEALEEQIKNLFMVWMKDDRGQPDRARVGMKQAIKAHQTARKHAVEWMPPICSN